MYSCAPPHTALDQPVAVFDRGGNFHGGMSDWLYVIQDDPVEVSDWILWLGVTGSQADDDRARLFPVAYTDSIWMTIDGDDDTEWIGDPEEELRRTAEILIYAWVAHAQKNWDQYVEAEALGDCRFPSEWAQTLLERSLNGDGLPPE